MTITIEHHPENGALPWVVVMRGDPFDELWFACATESEARQRAAERQARARELEKRE